MNNCKKNTSWNWESVKSNEWRHAAPEIFYLITRWKKLNLSNILDLGCGIGRHSLLFSENHFNVFSCDLSKTGLDMLSLELKKRALNATLNQVDMKDLLSVYKEDSFDAILSYRVINHANEKEFLKIVDNIIKILKPQGEAYIVVDSYNDYLKNNKNYNFVEKYSAIKIGGLEDGIIHHFARPSQFLENTKIEVLEIKEILDYKIDKKEFNPYKLHILFRKIR